MYKMRHTPRLRHYLVVNYLVLIFYWLTENTYLFNGDLQKKLFNYSCISHGYWFNKYHCQFQFFAKLTRYQSSTTKINFRLQYVFQISICVLSFTSLFFYDPSKFETTLSPFPSIMMLALKRSFRCFRKNFHPNHSVLPCFKLCELITSVM